MDKTIAASQLSKELSALLAEYGEEVNKALKEAVPDVAKKAKEEVKNHAPVRTGNYKKAIALKKTGETNTSISYTIWAGSEYRRAHLLEHGHAKVNGGRTKAIPHFKYGEDYAQSNLIPEITKKIGG